MFKPKNDITIHVDWSDVTDAMDETSVTPTLTPTATPTPTPTNKLNTDNVTNSTQNLYDQKTLSGKIVKLFSSKEKFTAGLLEPIKPIESLDLNGKGKDKVNFCFFGKLDLGEIVTLEGEWNNQPKYGWQFKADSYSVYIPEKNDVEGLSRYLAENKEFRGIGEVKARKIAELAMELTNGDLELLLSNGEYVQIIIDRVKLTQEQITGFSISWRANLQVNKTKAQLMSHGLTSYQGGLFIDKYGQGAITQLKTNPYSLIDDCQGIGFKRTDIIAMKIGFNRYSPLRVKAGVLAYLKESEKNGNTYVAWNDLFEGGKSLVGFLSLEGKKDEVYVLIENMVKTLVSEGKLHVEWRDDNHYVSTLDTYRIESLVVRRCYNLARRELNVWENDVKEAAENLQTDRELFERSPLNRLNTDQLNAVIKCLSSPIFLISGGAGTGKTFLIQSLITLYQLYSTKNLSIVLLAPTGTAADRITESTGFKASTIHRYVSALEIAEIEIANVDIILIDEFSMVSAELMYWLMSKIDIGKTKIILVGDKDQLPCIGLGDLIRDAITMDVNNNDSHSHSDSHSANNINCNWFNTGKLAIVQRQAGILKQVACSILTGRLLTPTKEQLTEESFFINENAQTNNKSRLKPFYLIKNRTMDTINCLQQIYKYYSEVLEQSYGIDLINEIQLLTAQHNGVLGTKVLNGVIQSIVQIKKGIVTEFGDRMDKLGLLTVDVKNVIANKEIFENSQIQDFKHRFYPGDKIVWTENNYNVYPNLMNGTIGIVKDVIEKGGDNGKDLFILEFKIEGKLAEYRIEAGTMESEQFMLAYALSTHKYQGKEIPITFLVVHKSQSFSHSRKWLYTGATRARKCLIVIGDEWAIQNALDKEDTGQRRTLTQYMVGRM